MFSLLQCNDESRIFFGGVFISTNSVEDRVQREREFGVESPLSTVSLNLQRNETNIIIVVNDVFFKEMGISLNIVKFRNFGGGCLNTAPCAQLV
jgi:hypothetical protein